MTMTRLDLNNAYSLMRSHLHSQYIFVLTTGCLMTSLKPQDSPARTAPA